MGPSATAAEAFSTRCIHCKEGVNLHNHLSHGDVSRCCAGGAEDPPRQPLELWVADAASGAARCLLRSPELGLNAIFDECATPNAEQSL